MLLKSKIKKCLRRENYMISWDEKKVKISVILRLIKDWIFLFVDHSMDLRLEREYKPFHMSVLDVSGWRRSRKSTGTTWGTCPRSILDRASNQRTPWTSSIAEDPGCAWLIHGGKTNAEIGRSIYKEKNNIREKYSKAVKSVKWIKSKTPRFDYFLKASLLLTIYV